MPTLAPSSQAPMPESTPHETPQQDGLFPQTQWTVISQARGSDDPAVAEGLRTLALGYWRPLYLYLRRRGEAHEDAADTVQGFFGHILSTAFLSHIDREGGKFRSYLLASLERWQSRNRQREQAVKRGGGTLHVPLDEVSEMENMPTFFSTMSPEEAYDYQWALEMVERATDKLRSLYAQRGRERWFDCLAGALPGSAELPPYPELAADLESTEGAVRKAVFDLRQAFAEMLHREIRATVRSPEEAQDELQHLIEALQKQ